eukprot:SAG11_NODE_4266_length_1979_cov_1.548936_2_plen_40_part_00
MKYHPDKNKDDAEAEELFKKVAKVRNFVAAVTVTGSAAS